MGGGTSKLDEEGRLRAQLQPFRWKIEEIKQRRRVRHASIVSTTELLSPEDRDDEDSVKKLTAVTEKNENEIEIEKAVDEKVTVVTEKNDNENTKGEMVKREDDELPGSPSFRVYCREAAPARGSDDDSVKVIQKIKEDRLAQEKERTQSTDQEKGRLNAHGRENSHDSLISNEDSAHKQHKKDKGRRFRGLTKAPSRMYTFLTIRGCYGPGNTTESSDESPVPGPGPGPGPAPAPAPAPATMH